MISKGKWVTPEIELFNFSDFDVLTISVNGGKIKDGKDLPSWED